MFDMSLSVPINNCLEVLFGTLFVGKFVSDILLRKVCLKF